MIYYLPILLITLVSFICCSELCELVLTDTDRYPMAHVNAVVYALYHILPLRNALFTSTLPADEEATEDVNSMQLVFARLYTGGPTNLVFLLENSYLSAESFQESPLRLPQFIDPKLFFSWSLGKLSEANPAIKEMFAWEVETSERLKDSAESHSLSEQETFCFNVNVKGLQPGHDLQSHLNSLVEGVESFIVHQNEKVPLQKSIVKRTRFTRLPSVLAFQFSNLNSATNLPLSESLVIEKEEFKLHSVIVSSAQLGNFLTIVRDGSQWKQYESDRAPIIISFEHIQNIAHKPLMLFYSKPHFLTVETVSEPSIDLKLQSCAMERLYSVGRTLLRSRTNTPTSPSFTTLHKTRQLRHFDFSDHQKSPANLSPLSSVNGVTWRSEPQEPKTLDFAGLLISRESKEILFEEAKLEDLEDQQAEPMQTSSPSRLQPLRHNSELQAEIYSELARPFARMRPPRPENYLYDWSAPSPIVHPENLFDTRRPQLSPLRPHRQQRK